MISLPSRLSHPTPRRQDFRHVSNYWAARVFEGLRTPIRWSAARFSRGVKPSQPGEWREGVLLGPSHIGDVLYNTASLPSLQAGLPNCRWTYLASQGGAAVLRGNPHLNRIIAIDDKGDPRSWVAQMRAELGKHSFDVALAYSRGSTWADLVSAILSGIPNRVGYVHKGFSGLVTHPVSLRFPQPIPACFRDLVGQLIAPSPLDVPSLRPRVYLQAAHEEEVDRMSAAWGIEWNRQPVLACAVTSRQPSGVWPRDRFLQAILHVKRTLPCTVILFGAKEDKAELTHLSSQIGSGTFVLAGELELLPVVALLRRCQVALTPDSGLRHLSNAAGVPVVFVRNISVRAIETGAYCDTEYDMAPPGLELVPPAQQPAAWAKIDPLRVGDQIVKLLRDWAGA